MKGEIYPINLIAFEMEAKNVGPYMDALTRQEPVA